MFNVLIRNTAVSAFAYFAISVLGIWVTGALAATYGLAAFGTITLARLFSASGLVGLFDLGAPENASYVVAQARATGNWGETYRAIQWLLLFTFLASIFCAAIILLFSHMLGVWLDIEKEAEVVFGHALVVSAVVLPLCLTGQVAEGVVRGFERYAVVRGLEVLASLAYAIGCGILISMKLPYYLVIYLYIAVMACRAVVAYGLAWKEFRQYAQVENMPIPEGVGRHMLERTWLVAPNKVLATIQTQSVPLVVGFVVGAAGAGVYDLLMRLPRFAKSALGLLNSAVMPFASRLEASDSRHALLTLYEHGLLIITFLTAPPLFALAISSKPLLHLWVGDALAQYWAWQSYAFLTPLLTVMIGFSSMSMFSKGSVLKIMSLTIIARLALQYGIAALLIGQLQERAFILGTTTAVLLTAIVELRMLLTLQGTERTAILNLVKLIFLCIVVGAAAFPLAAYMTTIPLLLLWLVSFTLVCWLVAWIAIIPRDFRHRLVINLKLSFLGWRK